MKTKWIWFLFIVFLFSLNGFAEEGVPCHESPQNAPSAPSTSSDSSPSNSPVSVPPSTGPVTGEPTNVKDQMGLTLNPPSGGTGGSATDPNLVGVGLPKVDNFGLIYGNDIAAKYLRLWQQMVQMKAKENADINEKVRRATWEKNSGLGHAREQFNKSRDQFLEELKEERAANDVYDKAVGEMSEWDMKKWTTEARQTNAEVGSKEWYDTIEENIKLDKQKPDMVKAMEKGWDKVLEARDGKEQARHNMQADLKRIDAAMDQYRGMEARYDATQHAPIPQPQR